MYAFGDNANGKLGVQTCPVNTFLAVPTLLSGMHHITKVAAGTYHSVAITEEGVAYSWG